MTSNAQNDNEKQPYTVLYCRVLAYKYSVFSPCISWKYHVNWLWELYLIWTQQDKDLFVEKIYYDWNMLSFLLVRFLQKNKSFMVPTNHTTPQSCCQLHHVPPLLILFYRTWLINRPSKIFFIGFFLTFTVTVVWVPMSSHMHPVCPMIYHHKMLSTCFLSHVDPEKGHCLRIFTASKVLFEPSTSVCIG